MADVDRVTGEPGRSGPATPRRHGREASGELVHVDVKKVARVSGGWRARSADALDHGRGSGGRLPCLHVAVDDRSRVAYAELPGDERKETCVAFMGRARDFYRGLGVEVGRVMTDSGPGCGVRHRARVHQAPRPLAERQGRAHERDARAGAAARAYASEGERAAALSSFIDRHDWARPHSACGGLPPISRIFGVDNVMAHNSCIFGVDNVMAHNS